MTWHVRFVSTRVLWRKPHTKHAFHAIRGESEEWGRKTRTSRVVVRGETLRSTTEHTRTDIAAFRRVNKSELSASPCRRQVEASRGLPAAACRRSAVLHPRRRRGRVGEDQKAVRLEARRTRGGPPRDYGPLVDADPPAYVPGNHGRARSNGRARGPGRGGGRGATG